MKFSTASTLAIATLAAANANVTATYEDIVTVYVTDCPITSTDAAGAVHNTTIRSTVTSTVCTKCTKSAARHAPLQTLKANINSTVVPTTHAPVQHPEVSPKQANAGSANVVGAAVLAVPMLMALF